MSIWLMIGCWSTTPAPPTRTPTAELPAVAIGAWALGDDQLVSDTAGVRLVHWDGVEALGATLHGPPALGEGRFAVAVDGRVRACVRSPAKWTCATLAESGASPALSDDGLHAAWWAAGQLWVGPVEGGVGRQVAPLNAPPRDAPWFDGDELAWSLSDGQERRVAWR